MRCRGSKWQLRLRSRTGLVPINRRVRKEESKEQTCLPRCGQAFDYRLLRRKQKSLAGERQSEGFLPDASISTGFACIANSCNRSPCASAPTPRSLNPTLWCCRVEWRCAWPSDTALDAHRNGWVLVNEAISRMVLFCPVGARNKASIARARKKALKAEGFQTDWGSRLEWFAITFGMQSRNDCTNCVQMRSLLNPA
jgi:hypothetical protein